MTLIMRYIREYKYRFVFMIVILLTTCYFMQYGEAPDKARGVSQFDTYYLKMPQKGNKQIALADTSIKVYNYKDLQLKRFDVTKIKLQFHPDFKNPCFLEFVNESMEWVYSDNKFITYPQYRKKDKIGSRLSSYLKYQKHGILLNNTGDLCQFHGGCRLRCLPYFMLIGAAKSGTSDFASKAVHHPQIFGAINKEVFYWTDFRFTLNATLGDYCDLFDASVSDLIKEKTSRSGREFYPRILSEYTSQTLGDDFFWREHPKNRGLKEPKYLNIHDIYKVNPNVKILTILRNPIDKLYSSYNMFRRAHMERTPQDFHERVLLSIEWWNKCTKVLALPVRACAYGCVPEMPPLMCEFVLEHDNRWGNVSLVPSGEILRAMYSVFVKDWLSVFPREQMLFLRTEDSYNMSKVLNREVFPFLGLEPVTKAQAPAMYNEEHRLEKIYKPMLTETRNILKKFYTPFKTELAELLGDEKWLWLDDKKTH